MIARDPGKLAGLVLVREAGLIEIITVGISLDTILKSSAEEVTQSIDRILRPAAVSFADQLSATAKGYASSSFGPP